MKNLYSLILSDEVIKRIDDVAMATGTNRSNLINQILADYVSYTTPEMRIKNILEQINAFFDGTEFTLPSVISGKSLSMKTSLDCKYRPTIHYSVELYRNKDESIGELRVLYRINLQELLYNLVAFFDLFIGLEKKYLKHNVNYNVAPGKFVRRFIIPQQIDYPYENVARAISDYVKNFDYIMKNYLMNKYKTIEQMENDYKIYLSKSILI